MTAPPSDTEVDTYVCMPLRLGIRLVTRLTAVVCLLAFVWVAWTARSLPHAFNPVDVGPGRLPILAAIVGVACCVMLFFRTGRDAEASELLEVRRPLCVAVGALVVVAYVLVLPYVGFYPASLVAVALLMVLGGERHLLVLAVGAIGFCLFVHVGFERLLNVPFP